MPRTTEPRTGQPTSVRLPRLTLDRIAQLRVLYNASTSTIVTMAVDRMHNQETQTMNDETVYQYADQNRGEMVARWLEMAGYNPADFKGQTPEAIATAIESFLRNDGFTPIWDDGQAVNMRRYLVEYLTKWAAE